jgi:hypothetical protein
VDKTNEPDADELAQRIQNRAAGRIDEVLRDERDDEAKAAWDAVWGSGVTPDGFVVPVDPEDMKRACRMSSESPGAAIGQSALASVCSSGASPIAIWYRLKMLAVCDYFGLLSAHKHDGGFTDAVFKVAATFPMRRMAVDNRGPDPFDTDEFVKEIGRASAGSA